MEIIIGILGLIIGIIIAIIPYFRKKYIHRPEVTIEITPNGGSSSPVGLSSRNEVNDQGFIDGNNAIRVFHLTWKYNIKITNNSELTAFYPVLKFNPNGPKFAKIDSINRLEPIKAAESLKLTAEYKKHEEAEGKNRTQVGQEIPSEFVNMSLLLCYENSNKRKFYTLYNFSNMQNTFLRKEPKDYKND